MKRGSLKGLKGLKATAEARAETATKAAPAPRLRNPRGLVPFALKREAKKQLRLLAATHERTQQDLLIEAVNMLFRQYGQKPIA